MKKIILLLIFTMSCISIHPKHIAINRYFIVDNQKNGYTCVYSPSTTTATTHLYICIDYSEPVKKGDTLFIVNNKLNIKNKH